MPLGQRFRNVISPVSVISTGHTVYKKANNQTHNTNGFVTHKDITLQPDRLQTRWYKVLRVTVSCIGVSAKSDAKYRFFHKGAQVFEDQVDAAGTSRTFETQIDIRSDEENRFHISTESDGSNVTQIREFVISAALVEWHG